MQLGCANSFHSCCTPHCAHGLACAVQVYADFELKTSQYLDTKLLGYDTLAELVEHGTKPTLHITLQPEPGKGGRIRVLRDKSAQQAATPNFGYAGTPVFTSQRLMGYDSSKLWVWDCARTPVYNSRTQQPMLERLVPHVSAWFCLRTATPAHWMCLVSVVVVIHHYLHHGAHMPALSPAGQLTRLSD